MLGGRSCDAALIAACTSRAAPSISRLRSNWTVMLAPPQCRGGGHLDHSGNLPDPPFQRGGKRRGGRFRIHTREGGVHKDGREIDNGQGGDRQREIGGQPGQKETGGQQRGPSGTPDERGRKIHRAGMCSGTGLAPRPLFQAVEVEIDDRRRVESDELREQQPPHDRHAEGLAEFRPGS